MFGATPLVPCRPYQTPYPVDEKYFLVSHDGTTLLRDYDRSEQVIVLKPRDGMGFYNPRPLRPRPRPPVRPALLEAPDFGTKWNLLRYRDYGWAATSFIVGLRDRPSG